MIGKAGLTVALVITAATAVHSIDLRNLYNQMYPVSTLKRDALYLCHEADPVFIRAVAEDRRACYSSMPHTIALALGLIRPDHALAGLFTPVGGLFGEGPLAADQSQAAWAAAMRRPPMSPRLIASAAPCPGTAAAEPDAISTKTALDALTGRGAETHDGALAELGIAPSANAASLPIPGNRRVAPPDLAATPPPAAVPGISGLTLLDAASATDLGQPSVASDPPATRCSTRI
ncbi:MAG TPA: hypothetical protein VND87_10635 [Stellaceae bacterium]|nr:hypothetical protein [Stellaceae bacterium]